MGIQPNLAKVNFCLIVIMIVVMMMTKKNCQDVVLRVEARI